MGGLADRVHRPAGQACGIVVEIPVPFAVEHAPFLCSLLSPNNVVMPVPSVFWVRGAEAGLLGSALKDWGSCALRCLSLYPTGEITA